VSLVDNKFQGDFYFTICDLIFCKVSGMIVAGLSEGRVAAVRETKGRFHKNNTQPHLNGFQGGNMPNASEITRDLMIAYITTKMESNKSGVDLKTRTKDDIERISDAYTTIYKAVFTTIK
jgi:hypothetical protein